MLFGGQVKIKEAYTPDKKYIITIVDNSRWSKTTKNFILNVHANFETNVLLKGTQEEVEERFNEIVELRKLIIA